MCNAPDFVLGFKPGFMCGMYMRDSDPGSMGVCLFITGSRFHGTRRLMCYYCFHSRCNSINCLLSKYTHSHNSGIDGSEEIS